MMYNNKLVVAVKANGKVLRELKDTVYVPFGTEYSLLIKNLDSVRAQVRVNIDGTEATDGVWLVIPANGEIEVERFIKNGNLNQGNRFKFIERTKSIEDGPRGVGVTDGLIRVEFQFEKRAPKVEHIERIYHDYYRPYWWYNARRHTFFGDDIVCSTYASNASASDAKAEKADLLNTKATSATLRSCNMVQSASLSATPAMPMNGSLDSTVTFAAADTGEKLLSDIQNDVGITVEGSVSDQKFNTASWFPVETETHVMVLKMLGETEQGKQVVKAVTVKQKPKCKTCGRTNKATAKFCTDCGTSLEIV